VSDRPNVRELLARLNPKNCRFDIGQGGMPTLTDTDIAGALGMVPNGLGRDILIYLHWPEGARIDRKSILRAMAEATRAEMDRRDELVRIARLAYHIERENWAERAHHNEQHRRDMDRARGEHETAKLIAWPHDPEMHARLRHSVLDEMSAPNHCRECAGRGERVVRMGVRASCPTCGGRGVIPVSDRQRADRLGRDESTYRRAWRSMYDWTWNLLSLEEGRAAEAFAAALGFGRSAAHVPE